MKAKLVSKEEINIEKFIYDLSIEKNNNYYANEVLVHNCKTPTSQQGKNLLKLTKAKHRIGMTGTLLITDPLDCYVPLKFIGSENGTFTNYKYYYCEFTGPFGNILTSYKNIEVLKNQLNNCSLRRTKELLNLPPKNIIHEMVDMSPVQEDFYNNIKNGEVKQADLVHISNVNLLALVARLRQITSCPQVLTTEKIPCAKVERAIDIAEQILSDPKTKVVLFGTFKATIALAAEGLKKYKPLIATGDISDQEVTKNIKEFQTNPNSRVFIGTWQKAGTGITLNAATDMIMLDSAWSAAQNEQTEDRIHRIGTKEPVFIHYIWTKNTIDEKVRQIVEDKSLLSGFIIDDELPPKLIDRLKQLIIDME